MTPPQPLQPEKAIDFLGIVVPAESTLFLTIVAFHIVIALGAVVVGIVAMLAKKGRGRHSTFGSIYFWLLGMAFGLSTVLSAMRWSHDWYLFALGVLAFGLALVGKAFADVTNITRLRIHASAMGASYIVMLTAFYVDNGKNLPLWRDLPPIAYWTVPALVGMPILVKVLVRHPLTRRV